MTVWGRWYTKNCARNWILTIWTNVICTTQNPSWKVRCMKFSRISRFKQISLIWTRKSDPILINEKKRLSFCGLCLSSRTQIKVQTDKSSDKYLNLAWEIKKLWNMSMMRPTIVAGTLRTVPKSLAKRLKELEIRGRIKTIQTTASFRSARIGRISRVTCETFCLQWKPTSNPLREEAL